MPTTDREAGAPVTTTEAIDKDTVIQRSGPLHRRLIITFMQVSRHGQRGWKHEANGEVVLYGGHGASGQWCGHGANKLGGIIYERF